MRGETLGARLQLGARVFAQKYTTGIRRREREVEYGNSRDNIQLRSQRAKAPGDLWKPFRGALSRMIHGIDSILYTIRYGSITRDLREDRRAAAILALPAVLVVVVFRDEFGFISEWTLGRTDGRISRENISSLIITSG